MHRNYRPDSKRSIYNCSFQRGVAMAFKLIRPVLITVARKRGRIRAAASLLQQRFKTASGFADTEVTAEYGADKILCTLSGEESSSAKTIRIPPGASIVSDSTTGILVSKLASGGADFLYLNPLTLALEKLHVVFKGKESV